MTPSPAFHYTTSYLLQEEQCIKHCLQMEAQIALLAAHDTSTAKSTLAPTPPPDKPYGLWL